MLPKSSSSSLTALHRGSALPWFLRPFFALLWPIIALVLLLAFLIISYLPSTTVATGFDPRLPSFVSDQGYNSTNFLYSFLPTVLAMFCLLFWMSIDLAYRRLQPCISLTKLTTSAGSDHPDTLGDSAERTLLPSYPADFPGLATLTAILNGHWRPALTSFITLTSTALPILAGGIFWAQFYPSTQSIRISAHMTAYYALSAFLAIHTLAYLAVYPPSTLRSANLPENINTFAGIRSLVAQSRLLDDLAFRAPSSKVDLVTRLLSSANYSSRATGPKRSHPDCDVPSGGEAGIEGAGNSRVSLIDSLRGFGRARRSRGSGSQSSDSEARGWQGLQGRRFGFGRWIGRDGREFEGIDREKT
jgi:hypothetical protein